MIKDFFLKYSAFKSLFKQISWNIFFKFFSLIVNLIIIKLLVNKLELEEYGIWVVLFSLAQWFTISDIGIGNGLRNKLAEAYSKKNYEEARQYISTAYFILGALLIFISLIINLSIYFINWKNILNINKLNDQEAKIILYYFFNISVLNFYFSIINQIFFAIQKSSWTNIPIFFTNVIFLFYITFIEHNFNLKNIILIFCFVQLFIILFTSIIFYRSYKVLIPHINEIKKGKIRDILNLGIKFFIIQLTGVIIFSTDNFIITHYLGPNYVTSYNLNFTIFNYVFLFFNLIFMPFWSSYTKAFVTNNIIWLKDAIKFNLNLILPAILILILLTIFFNDLLFLWVRKKIEYPKYLPFYFAVYIFLMIWTNLFVYLLNGISKIKLSFILSIFIAIINLPLAKILAVNYKLGLNGIVLSNLICLIPSAIFFPLQVFYLFFSNKKYKFLESIFNK